MGEGEVGGEGWFGRFGDANAERMQACKYLIPDRLDQDSRWSTRSHETPTVTRRNSYIAIEIMHHRL